MNRPSFQYQMTASRPQGIAQGFPFAVTTASARHPGSEENNSQDAVSLITGKNYVARIVSDGCFSTHPKFQEHSTSSNEVAAKLTCWRLALDVERIMADAQKPTPEQVTKTLGRGLISSLRANVRAVCGRNKNMVEEFIFDACMATVVGFVVTTDVWWVFHCGDGVVNINGTWHSLAAASGTYPANRLLAEFYPTKFKSPENPHGVLEVVKSGKTRDLNSILIGSDGFESMLKHPSDLLSDLIPKPNPDLVRNGFEFLLENFQAAIASHPELNFNDDSSFCLCRRLSQPLKEPNMMKLTQTDINQSGGLLSAMLDKSNEYARGLLIPKAKGINGTTIQDLHRLIVHTSPHLDEYLAEFLFRAALPTNAQAFDFIEQSVFSKDNDLGCQHLWPDAAVFGIGGTVSGGAQALAIFDEHIPAQAGQSRTMPSCSAVVYNRMVEKSTPAVQALLLEINVLDDEGGAHEQHLGNIIKTLHETRFHFGVDSKTSIPIRDYLPAEWKRAIINAAIAGLLYCLENGVALDDAGELKRSVTSAMNQYFAATPHRSHPCFADAIQRLRSTYGDQAKVLANALLKTNGVPIQDSNGKPVTQLGLLATVCLAAEKCWGEKARDIIMSHLLEPLLQGQLNFQPVRDAIDELFSRKLNSLVSPLGTFQSAIIPNVNCGRGRGAPLWIISITPSIDVIQANKGAQNFINSENSIGKDLQGRKQGFGLVLVHDPARGSSYLAKCPGVNDAQWKRLVDMILESEPDCWYVVTNKSGIAPFILNGNRAHQYVPRSGLEIKSLAYLAEKVFC